MAYLITPDIFTKNMNILVYGDAGAGKTHFAGTAQDHSYMKNVLVFNIDGGIMTLADRGDIQAVNINSLDQLEQEFYKLASKDPEYAGINTIVIDNITELQLMSLEKIVQTEYKNRIKKDKFYTIDDIWQEDYGKSTRQLQRLLRGFRDLPMHAIYIAHRKDKIRKGTTLIEESKPSLSEKLCSSVMGYMDYVWYLYTQDVAVDNNDGTFGTRTERYMLTQPINNYLAKTRGSEFAKALGSIIVNPNMNNIMNVYINTYSIQNKK